MPALNKAVKYAAMAVGIVGSALVSSRKRSWRQLREFRSRVSTECDAVAWSSR